MSDSCDTRKSDFKSDFVYDSFCVFVYKPLGITIQYILG